MVHQQLINTSSLTMTFRCQLLLVSIAVHMVVEVTTGTQIHQPWLKRSPANVLKLDCEPHPSKRSDLSELRLSFRSETNGSQDKTLAKITEINVKLNEDPTDSQYTPDDAQVTFKGKWDWEKMSIATARLSIVMPPIISNKSVTYSCISVYSENEVYSTNFSVRTIQPIHEERDNFEVTITKVDRVVVTWKPTKFTFVAARVSLTSLDNIGQEIAAPMPLFATNGKKGLVFNKMVLLHKFRSPPEMNYSIHVYIDSTLCEPFCRYSCTVPHKICIGSDARLCECCQVLHDGYSSECTAKDPVNTSEINSSECTAKDPVNTSEINSSECSVKDSGDTYEIPFFALLFLNILIIIISCVLCCIFRRYLQNQITGFCNRNQNPSSNLTNDRIPGSTHAHGGYALVPTNKSGSNEDGNGRSQHPTSNHTSGLTNEPNQAQGTAREQTQIPTNESGSSGDVNMRSQRPTSNHTSELQTEPNQAQGTAREQTQTPTNESGSGGDEIPASQLNLSTRAND